MSNLDMYRPKYLEGHCIRTFLFLARPFPKEPITHGLYKMLRLEFPMPNLGMYPPKSLEAFYRNPSLIVFPLYTMHRLEFPMSNLGIYPPKSLKAFYRDLSLGAIPFPKEPMASIRCHT